MTGFLLDVAMIWTFVLIPGWDAPLSRQLHSRQRLLAIEYANKQTALDQPTLTQHCKSDEEHDHEKLMYAIHAAPYSVAANTR